jgi:SAM-dependent methyltransferase
MSGRTCIACGGSGPFAEIYELVGFRLVRCPDCGLVFQEPQPDEAVLDGSYYHDPGFTDALFGELREYTLERAREKLAFLRRVGAARAGTRVLDVGCSSGAWLEVAQDNGMTATGVEIGAATSERARSRGLDVRTGTLEQAIDGLRGERYDLITFWDVLEHLRDPRRELELARSLLAPGGVVAATFPNVEGWYPRLTYRLFARRTGKWEYPELPVHLYDFSPATAGRLLERLGYRVLGTRTYGTPFEFYRETSLTIERLGQGRRARVLRAAFEALRMVVYPLARLFDRGNAMFVAATPAPDAAGAQAAPATARTPPAA